MSDSVRARRRTSQLGIYRKGDSRSLAPASPALAAHRILMWDGSAAAGQGDDGATEVGDVDGLDQPDVGGDLGDFDAATGVVLAAAKDGSGLLGRVAAEGEGGAAEFQLEFAQEAAAVAVGQADVADGQIEAVEVLRAVPG